MRSVRKHKLKTSLVDRVDVENKNVMHIDNNDQAEDEISNSNKYIKCIAPYRNSCLIFTVGIKSE